MRYNMIDLKFRPEVRGKSVVGRLGFPFVMVTVGAFFMAIFIVTLCFAGLSGSLDEKHILLRLQPIGEVTIEAGGTEVPVAKTVITADIGQQRYEEYCHICH